MSLSSLDMNNQLNRLEDIPRQDWAVEGFELLIYISRIALHRTALQVKSEAVSTCTEMSSYYSTVQAQVIKV